MESRVKLAGHAVHLMLIAFPLGLLCTAVAFDIISLVTGNARWTEMAYYMIGAGLIGGLPPRCLAAGLAGDPGRNPRQADRAGARRGQRGRAGTVRAELAAAPARSQHAADRRHSRRAGRSSGGRGDELARRRAGEPPRRGRGRRGASRRAGSLSALPAATAARRAVVGRSPGASAGPRSSRPTPESNGARAGRRADARPARPFDIAEALRRIRRAVRPLPKAGHGLLRPRTRHASSRTDPCGSCSPRSEPDRLMPEPCRLGAGRSRSVRGSRATPPHGQRAPPPARVSVVPTRGLVIQMMLCLGLGTSGVLTAWIRGSADDVPRPVLALDPPYRRRPTKSSSAQRRVGPLMRVRLGASLALPTDPSLRFG